MRILLAIDGSICSDRARDLVSTLPLPAGTQLRVVAVDTSHPDLLSLAWVPASSGATAAPARESDAQMATRHLREALSRAEGVLERPGVSVESLLLRGRPATAIVDEALTFGADLVVVGSRGHGAIASMLLGSTAAEVVDHAPCPVLVARHAELGSIAFADDGSPAARHAEELLGSWPLFAGRRIDVVTVAETQVPVSVGLVPGVDGAVMESYAESVESAREERREEARAVAARLHEAGHDASATLLEGHPAAELLRFAADRTVGTFVLGTRGHTGLTRMVLGSVARNVLLHAQCSVLVVRQPAKPAGSRPLEPTVGARR